MDPRHFWKASFSFMIYICLNFHSPQMIFTSAKSTSTPTPVMSVKNPKPSVLFIHFQPMFRSCTSSHHHEQQHQDAQAMKFHKFQWFLKSREAGDDWGVLWPSLSWNSQERIEIYVLLGWFGVVFICIIDWIIVAVWGNVVESRGSPGGREDSNGFLLIPI